jgi:cytochrome c553
MLTLRFAPPGQASQDAASLEATRQKGVSRGGSHEAAADNCSRCHHSTGRGSNGRAYSPAAAHTSNFIGLEAARSTKHLV